jgi:integrase
VGVVVAARYITKAGVRWRARWRTGEGERQSRGGFLSNKEAREYEEAMRTARRKGEPVRRPKTRVTVEWYWEVWWAQEVTVAKARATQRSYKAAYVCYIGPWLSRVKLVELIDDPQILVNWRLRLARDRSQPVLTHAHGVLSSMLSAAAEEGLIPHNPLMGITTAGGRGRKRVVGRSRPRREPVAVDPAAWFLVMEYLRRPPRPAITGEKARGRCGPLHREHGALIVALGFMAGFRLPSEALGLSRGDVRAGRVYMEGRSSAGEYTPGSKTGPGRDLPIQPELLTEFERVERAYADTGRPLGVDELWISINRDGIVWSESRVCSWRQQDFRPVTERVAADFPQFAAELRSATPYCARHTFISCCLQAGISLATIAAWCGTSIQMISKTYGRMIARYEGISPVPLDAQLRTGRLEAASLLSSSSRTPSTRVSKLDLHASRCHPRNDRAGGAEKICA